MTEEDGILAEVEVSRNLKNNALGGGKWWMRSAWEDEIIVSMISCTSKVILLLCLDTLVGI